MRGTNLVVLTGALAFAAAGCCEKKQESVQQAAAVQPAAPAVPVAPPQIDYEKLATLVAEKIDTEKMVNKVVDKL